MTESKLIKLKTHHLLVINEMDELVENILQVIHYHNTQVYNSHYLCKNTYCFHFAIFDNNVLWDSTAIDGKIIMDRYLKKYNRNIEVFSDFSTNISKFKRNDEVHYIGGNTLLTSIAFLTYNPYLWLFYKNNYIDPPIYHYQIMFTSQLNEEKIL